MSFPLALYGIFVRVSTSRIFFSQRKWTPILIAIRKGTPAPLGKQNTVTAEST